MFRSIQTEISNEDVVHGCIPSKATLRRPKLPEGEHATALLVPPGLDCFFEENAVRAAPIYAIDIQRVTKTAYAVAQWASMINAVGLRYQDGYRDR